MSFAKCYVIVSCIAVISSVEVNYNFTSLLIKEGNHSNTRKSRFVDIAETNLTIITKYVTLPRSHSLSNVLRVIEQNKLGSDESRRHYTSLLPLPTNNIIESAWSSLRQDRSSWHLGSCSMDLDDLTFSRRCTKFTKTHLRVIRAFVKKYSINKLAIVTQKESCALKFSKKLNQITKEISKSHSRPVEVLSYLIRDDYVDDIRSALHSININTRTLVILLSNNDLTALAFKLAGMFPSLLKSQLWLTVEFNFDFIDKGHVPSQLINIQNVSPSSLSYVNPFQLLDSMNELLVLEDVYKRGFITKSQQEKRASFPSKYLQSNVLCYSGENSSKSFITFRKSIGKWVNIFGWTGKELQTMSHPKEFIPPSKPPIEGALLRVTTAIEQPYIYMSHKYYSRGTCSYGILCKTKKPVVGDNDEVYNQTCCVGFNMELLQKLQKEIGFHVDLHVNDVYGALVNGTWNGMVGEVAYGQADLITAALTVTKERAEVIDFTESYVEISLAFVMMSAEKAALPFVNFKFMSYLSTNLLLSINAMFWIGFLVLYFFENISRKGANWSSKFKYSANQSFTYLSGLTFQRDLGGKAPKSATTRLTAIAFAFAMTVIMSTYTAMLTAVAVQEPSKVAFNGIRDKRLSQPTTSFKFTAMKDSSTSQYFKHNANPTLRRMYLFMKKYAVTATSEGYRKLLSGNIQAFIDEYETASIANTKLANCQLRIEKLEVGKSSWAFAVKKGSLWNQVISERMLQYKENGYLAQLEKKWLFKSCSSNKNTVSPSRERFSLTNFGGLVVILCGCFGFCFCIVLIEKAWNMLRNKRSESGRISV